MDRSCKARGTARRLCPMGRIVHGGHQEYADERGTSFPKVSGGFLLQTRADNRRGSHRARCEVIGPQVRIQGP